MTTTNDGTTTTPAQAELLPATRPDATPEIIQPATAPDVNGGGVFALIGRALDKGADIETVERLAALYEKQLAREDLERGREEEQTRKRIFADRMAAAQSEMVRVEVDASNSQTHSKYATYGALDRMARPIYTAHGFCLTFEARESTTEGNLLIVGTLSLRAEGLAFEREYPLDMPADGMGAKGGAVMTRTHATGAAMRYAMRYLLTMIFNLAIGKDDDGNAADAKTAPGPGAERVTAEQVLTLEEACETHGSDPKAVCKFGNAATFEDMTQDGFKQCCAMFNRKDREARA